jgi:probable rRNA maturation factor
MEIDVLVDEGITVPFGAKWLRGIAGRVLASESAGSNAELSLVITGQDRIRQLNRDYRDKDEPTDVLAFAATGEGGAELPPFVSPPDGVRHLGEVVISHPQAVMQAAEHQHPVKREIAILVIHGVLHLLGYEHDVPERESQMRTREAEILSSIGEGWNEDR